MNVFFGIDANVRHWVKTLFGIEVNPFGFGAEIFYFKLLFLENNYVSHDASLTDYIQSQTS